MPTIGPESYKFLLYVTYEATDRTKPKLVAYRTTGERYSPTAPDPTVPDVLMHAENEDLETTLTIARSVTETVAHQSAKAYRALLPPGQIAVRSALEYLEKTYDQQYYEFLAECWTCAQADLNSMFPKRFPPS